MHRSSRPGLFVADSGNNDPCSTALSSLGSGATIRRAGLWSGTSNHVVVRCGSPLALKQTYQGSSAISDAASWASGKNYCWFQISALELPVFQKPWSTSTTIKAFAGPDRRLGDLPVGGCGNYTAPATLDHLAHHVVFEDHTGYDWWDEAAKNSQSHNSTWNVRAVADGVVWFAGGYEGNQDGTVGCNPDANGGTCVNLVVVRHYVGAVLNDTHESFLTKYYHMDDIDSDVYEGASISAGDIIGSVGDTGADHDHLHFSVIRLTNTSAAYRLTADDVLFSSAGVLDQDYANMPYSDPFGWRTTSCWEPATQQTAKGASSIDLWTSGYYPPDWNHAAGSSGWEIHDP